MSSSTSLMEEGRGPVLTPEQHANAEALLGGQGRVVHRHRADCFDYFCRFLNVATGLCAILCAVSYGMALYVYQPVENVNGMLDQALRVFGLLWAVIIAIIEIEWERILLLIRFTEYWVGRSILQIFTALLTFKMASAAGKDCREATGKDCDFHKSLELYRTIAAMALLCCGTVYFLGGILCFGLIKRSRSNRERKRAQAQRDLDELESKRDQLRNLLGHSRDD
mmetsp:Transcript_20645/g.62199  ORF Transcript_20645/g.62199 Transcript_20645/m.62199 type:complete len:224 (+) Transcript_20645:367-1038(+)|eukprot:CAMPEP_0206140934 /NCGR_PEP_ID=MMETSP1473-20131121/11228_1 /ASSEMBLY_ACC=CAM_ASM_001109 /TAXON_ID=1461547 /ORGANISM="Stichococcus sp, Strain RCC1054" /LENGTH=223 /DNA_ID=CAMNT_0053535289 /DNA_START=286 /DNA_END=957 /DNA_ORIENTATION=+